MQLCWIIIYITIFVSLVFLIPISIFYYETDDDKPIVLINKYKSVKELH